MEKRERQENRGRGLWFKITGSLMLIAATGVGVWAVVDKLDETTFKVVVGVVLTLAIVVVVGLLFIGYGVMQAYLVRRAVQQDDLNDMKQMAFIARLMPGSSGGSGRVNVQLPGQQGVPMLGPSQLFDGRYRDTTVGDGVPGRIEVE